MYVSIACFLRNIVIYYMIIRLVRLCTDICIFIGWLVGDVGDEVMRWWRSWWGNAFNDAPFLRNWSINLHWKTFLLSVEKLLAIYFCIIFFPNDLGHEVNVSFPTAPKLRSCRIQTSIIRLKMNIWTIIYLNNQYHWIQKCVFICSCSFVCLF